MRKGETIIIPENTSYWWIRSHEEIELMRKRDHDMGRFQDDAGEPIMYSGVGYSRLTNATSAIVTKTTNVPWNHWVKKPKRLVECLATVGNTARIILVKADTCMHDP